MNFNRERVFVICTKMEYLNLYFVNQVNILSELFLVYVLCPPHDPKYKVIYKGNEYIKFIELEVNRKLNIWTDIRTFFRLVELIRLLKPTLVQSLMPKAGFLGMTTAKMLGVEARLHVFTGQVWANSRGPKRFLLKMADRIIVLCASFILTDSESQAHFLVDNGVLNREKVGYLGNGSISGVDLLRFNADKRSEHLMEQKSNDFVCVFLGRLTKDKGFNHILKAGYNAPKY